MVDALNAGLGKNTVYFGGAQTALDSAPRRKPTPPNPVEGEYFD